MSSPLRRAARLAVAAAAPVLAVSAAVPAGACGGLVGENGTIQLTRTTTLAAYHEGVERYVTSFTFTGEGEEVGSITPLPGVPTKVERGGGGRDGQARGDEHAGDQGHATGIHGASLPRRRRVRDGFSWGWTSSRFSANFAPCCAACSPPVCR